MLVITNVSCLPSHFFNSKAVESVFGLLASLPVSWSPDCEAPSQYVVCKRHPRMLVGVVCVCVSKWTSRGLYPKSGGRAKLMKGEKEMHL